MNNDLLMPFIDGSHSFVNGFECGQVWEEMSQNRSFAKRLVDTENIPQIHLMAEHFGYLVSIDLYDDCWSYLNGHPVDISFIGSLTT